MENERISLSTLQESVREKIETDFSGSLWVCGEVAEFSLRSGHCYMTLVENGPSGIVARARAIVWSSVYRTLAPYFQSVTGKQIEVGMSILLKVRVQYSPLYALSLIVADIDPSFTIGEAEMERRRTIARLEEDGMMELNSTLQLPVLPRRFAIISSHTAAGYGDFMNHLHHNEYGYSYHTELFEALMQGGAAPREIVAALTSVAERANDFDLVIILRGGGSSTDLACFDNYDLALNIAQFPLPVYTAIGHDRDFHVADMVAARYFKTPTAVADYFVDYYSDQEAMIESLIGAIRSATSQRLMDAKMSLESIKMRLSRIYSNKKEAENEKLVKIHRRLSNATAAAIYTQQKHLSELEVRIEALNPQAILGKGFALPLKGGRRVDGAADLSAGDLLTLIMRDGRAECRVISKS